MRTRTHAPTHTHAHTHTPHTPNCSVQRNNTYKLLYPKQNAFLKKSEIITALAHNPFIIIIIIIIFKKVACHHFQLLPILSQSHEVSYLIPIHSLIFLIHFIIGLPLVIFPSSGTLQYQPVSDHNPSQLIAINTD